LHSDGIAILVDATALTLPQFAWGQLPLIEICIDQQGMVLTSLDRNQRLTVARYSMK